MGERMTRQETWSYGTHVLKNGTDAVKGEIACLEIGSGLVVPGDDAVDLLPIGYFDESVEGDGVATVNVRYFVEHRLDRFDNDTAPNAVEAADVGGFCFIKDGRTVSALGTDRSVAGRVWGVTARGVLVEMASTIGPAGPEGAEGPTGPAGPPGG